MLCILNRSVINKVLRAYPQRSESAMWLNVPFRKWHLRNALVDKLPTKDIFLWTHWSVFVGRAMYVKWKVCTLFEPFIMKWKIVLYRCLLLDGLEEKIIYYVLDLILFCSWCWCELSRSGICFQCFDVIGMCSGYCLLAILFVCRDMSVTV